MGWFTTDKKEEVIFTSGYVEIYYIDGEYDYYPNKGNDVPLSEAIRLYKEVKEHISKNECFEIDNVFFNVQNIIRVKLVDNNE